MRARMRLESGSRDRLPRPAHRLRSGHQSRLPRVGPSRDRGLGRGVRPGEQRLGQHADAGQSHSHHHRRRLCDLLDGSFFPLSSNRCACTCEFARLQSIEAIPFRTQPLLTISLDFGQGLFQCLKDIYKEVHPRYKELNGILALNDSD